MSILVVGQGCGNYSYYVGRQVLVGTSSLDNKVQAQPSRQAIDLIDLHCIHELRKKNKDFYLRTDGVCP